MKPTINKYIELCAAHLALGHTLLYPTDTVWGIGCDATNAEAVEQVFAIKQRPAEKSLIVLVDSIEMLMQYVDVTPEIENMLFSFTEPTTVIYPNPVRLAKNVISEDNTVAIRYVKHPFCQQLIRSFGKPIVSTSANISGEKTPQLFEQIAPEIIEGVDVVVSRKYDTSTYKKPSRLIRIHADKSIEYLR